MQYVLAIHIPRSFSSREYPRQDGYPRRPDRSREVKFRDVFPGNPAPYESDETKNANVQSLLTPPVETREAVINTGFLGLGNRNRSSTDTFRNRISVKTRWCLVAVRRMRLYSERLSMSNSARALSIPIA
jgi:hypothetical protein